MILFLPDSDGVLLEEGAVEGDGLLVGVGALVLLEQLMMLREPDEWPPPFMSASL